MSLGVIGLSFDDGPSAWTGEILDLLSSHAARATFFVIGSAAQERPELTARIAAEGHELGNHTWSHPSLARDCDEPQIRQELQRTSDLVEQLSGSRPALFRAPHYDHDDRVDAIAADLGLRHADGDVAPPDWHARMTAAVIATFVLQGISPGAIVGLHDGVPPREAGAAATRRPTVDAVARILPALAEREIRCATVSEIMAS